MEKIANKSFLIKIEFKNIRKKSGTQYIKQSSIYTIDVFVDDYLIKKDWKVFAYNLEDLKKAFHRKFPRAIKKTGLLWS